MGFGYVLLGLFVSLNFVYEAITMPLAVALLLLGMLTLGAYNRPLKEARLALCPLGAVAVLAFVYEGGYMLGLISPTARGNAMDFLSPASTLCFLLFLWRLFAGIAELGKETELPEVTVRAKRNIVFSFIAYTAYLFINLPLPFPWYKTFAVHAVFPVLVCRMVVAILNLLLLFTCYRLICRPEDVDMPRKKTGIGFLDRFHEEMDEKEEKRQKEEKEALTDLYRKREKEYHEKQEKKKGGKKKK